MGEINYLRGNDAAALAAKLARIGFMSAYPNPPANEVMESIREYIDRNELAAGFVEADGEKNSLGASMGAAALGVRSFNATASQGLAYMHELLHCMAGSRIPMVMMIANRSVFAPQGLHCDHTDSLSQAETGWLQFYCENVQDILDTTLQAFKVAENPQVKLPAMVCYDGYVLSHSLQRVDVPTQAEVDAFLPPYRPGELDHLEPGGLPLFTSFGMMENWFMEFKYQQRRAEERAGEVMAEVSREFAGRFGRSHGELIDTFAVDDADVVLVLMGSTVSTARFAAQVMRRAGKRVGVIKIRSFRPFPAAALAATLARSTAKAVIVMDRIFHGVLYDEVRSALYDLPRRPLVMGIIYGLNGRDTSPYNIIDLAERGFAAIRAGHVEAGPSMYMVRHRGEVAA